MESSELNLNEQESWLRIHTIPYKVNSVGQTAAGRLHFKQDGDNEWKNLGFILRTINRPIFRGLWGLKRTQNKTVCEVIPYLNLTEKENISESCFFFFPLAFMEFFATFCNFNIKNTGCLTKQNYLLLTLDKTSNFCTRSSRLSRKDTILSRLFKVQHPSMKFQPIAALGL